MPERLAAPIISVTCSECGAKALTYASDDAAEYLRCDVPADVIGAEPCGHEVVIQRRSIRRESNVVAIICGPGGSSKVVTRD